MKPSRRTLMSVIGALLASGVATIAAVSVSNATPATTGASATPSTNAPALPQMTFSEQASLFPALARPAAARDSVLTEATAQMAASAREEPQPIVIDTEQVREIDTASGVDIGIVPSGTGMCVIAAYSGGRVAGACSPKESLEATGLNVSFQNEHLYYVVGALPSTWRGVSVAMANGHQAPVSLNENNGYAVVSTEPPADVVVTTGAGTEHRLPQVWSANSRRGVVGASLAEAP
jgi:hypothetical protein